MDNDHINFNNRPFINDLVTPQVLDLIEPPEIPRVQQAPFNFFQTLSYSRPAAFNFHLTSDIEVVPIHKKVQCRPKRKNFQTMKV
jgi:hypothetical protein